MVIAGFIGNILLTVVVLLVGLGILIGFLLRSK